MDHTMRPALRFDFGNRLVLSAVIVLAMFPGRPAAAAEQSKAPPTDWNVVLISIDTLRADRMSVYGYDRDTSPYLEELSRSAVVFEEFSYSGGGTLPSHMSMLTSLNPTTHRVHNTRNTVLGDGRITLAEQLREAGYATAAFTDGGWVRAEFGFDQGFDTYDDQGGHFETILPKAEGWIRNHTGEKFFLFLHTYDVHTDSLTPMPYSCPGDSHLRYVDPASVAFSGCRFEKCATALLKHVNSKIYSGEWSSESAFWDDEIEFISSTYDGCIRYVDQQLRDFFSLLDELDMYDSTVIVITSDHGEEFAEHGMFLHDQAGFETLAAIPLIIRFPGGVFGGRRVQPIAATIDIMPTILDFLEIQVNDQAQGRSLLPAIQTGSGVREDVHMFDVVRYGRWKYFPRQRRLFDLVADPEEQRNVYDEHSDVVEALSRRSNELISIDNQAYRDFQVSEPDSVGEVTLSEQELDELRALGYLD